MHLLFSALRKAIDEAAKDRGIESYKIVWKHNARGEFFIGVVTTDPRFARDKLETARERTAVKPRRD